MFRKCREKILTDCFHGQTSSLKTVTNRHPNKNKSINPKVSQVCALWDSFVLAIWGLRFYLY